MSSSNPPCRYPTRYALPRPSPYYGPSPGWGAGQLENEISQNGWLTCPADPELLFADDIDNMYDRILASIGVDTLHLSNVAGHA